MVNPVLTATISMFLVALLLGSSSSREGKLVGRWIHVSVGYIVLDYTASGDGVVALGYEYDETTVLYAIDEFVPDDEAFVLHLSAVEGEMDDTEMHGRVVDGWFGEYLELWEDDGYSEPTRIKFARAEMVSALKGRIDEALRKSTGKRRRSHFSDIARAGASCTI